MRRRSIRRLLKASFRLTLLLASVGPCFPSRLAAQVGPLPDDVARESLVFTQIYGALEKNYTDSIDPDRTILEGAVRGMLSALDPFSAFFNRDQFELLQQQSRGEALGFGSILYVQPGKVVVLQAAERSPSWRAGLGPGDEIVSINGTRLNRLDFSSLVELLRSSRSHPVRLGVIHPGKLVAQEVDLKPAEVALPTVDKAFELSAGIGYIHLSSFEQKTPQELIEAIARLGGSKLKGLVLDLRDNHGGLLGAAVAVASLFLKPDLAVLTVRGRSLPEKTYWTEATASSFDLPLIVLVNGDTASAAEVVAAALQEHDRAVIAGETTYGKGAVESVLPLSEKTGLALTTAQYFTPSGRSIQRPLPGTALADAVGAGPTLVSSSPITRRGSDRPARTDDAPRSGFCTDSGRPVSAGGGVAPDARIPSRALDLWASFLNQRGAFTGFASQYLAIYGKVAESFEPDAKLLADFKDYLTRQGIRTPEEYWSQDQDYLKLRLKTEIFNLVFGLARGTEVDTRSDPQVQQAAALFSKMTDLLKDRM